MRRRSRAEKHDVRLRVAVRGPNHTMVDGVTEYISNRDIRFAVTQPFALDLGAPLVMFVSVPSEITAGHEVFIRASGQVLSVEHSSDSGVDRMLFTAAIRKYDFIRSDVSPHPRPCQSRDVALHSNFVS